MRSAVEQQLNLIAQGRANFHEVKQHTLDIFHLKFRYFVQHINAMDELFEVTFSSLASSGRPISRYLLPYFSIPFLHFLSSILCFFFLCFIVYCIKI